MLEKLPGKQGRQVVLPVVFVKVPDGQFKQLDRPDVFEKVPYGQLKHSRRVVFGYVPGEQLKQGAVKLPFVFSQTVRVHFSSDPSSKRKSCFEMIVNTPLLTGGLLF
jgi:hypothetical protein